MKISKQLLDAGSLVSVIIPTHNRPDLLRNAVASVIAQTYRPIEIVIVDDGSADTVNNAWFKNKSKDVFLSIHRNNVSKGVAAARNVGIIKSRGNFIAFLDDDDQWVSEKLMLQMDALFKHNSSKIRGVFCQMIVEDEDGNEIRRTSFPAIMEQVLKSMVYGDGNIPLQTLLIERDAVRTVGLFDEQMPPFDDRHWLMRYLFSFEMILVNKYLVRFLEHSGDRLTTSPDAMLAGEQAFTKFIKNYLKTQCELNFNKAMGYRYAKLANEYILTGQLLSGLKSFLKGISTNPLELRAWAGFMLSLSGTKFYRKIMSRHMLRVRLANISNKTVA
jgi:glycosyltransferase involved in cell wall biosynthesis